MKQILLSRQARIIVDILLVIVLIITVIVSKQQVAVYDNYWQSPHCLFSLLWFGLITLHAWQNWKMIKAFTRKKVIRKNKVTSLVILCYMLMLVSILTFMMDTDIFLMHFHHITGRLFMLAILIHVADKFKKFIRLFKGRKTAIPSKKFSYSK